MKIWLYLDIIGILLGLGIIIINLVVNLNASIGGGVLIVIVATMNLFRNIGELKRKPR
jgi:hypothetical protein